MSKVTQELIDAGMLERHQAADRRRVGFSVTAKGRRTVEAVRQHRTAWLAARLQNLEPDELDALEAAIPLLAKLLEGDAE
jgi:DNA-binding MarR family transcriptional regulator